MYRNISMAQRLDKIGELLAKGIYLYLKRKEEIDEKERNNAKINNDEVNSLTENNKRDNIKAVNNPSSDLDDNKPKG